MATKGTGSTGLTGGGLFSRIATCFAALVRLHVGHGDGQAVVGPTGWSGWWGVVAQSVGNHTSGSYVTGARETEREKEVAEI